MVKVDFRRSLCFSKKEQQTWWADDSALRPDLPVCPYSVSKTVASLPHPAEGKGQAEHPQLD